MGMKRYGTVDLETGEIVDGTMVVVGRRVRWKECYLMTFQDKLEELSLDSDFTGTNLRVMMNLMSRLGWENWLHINQTDIARRMGVNRVEVSKTVNLLIRKGVIIRGPKIGRCYSYKLNSSYGFKGKLHDLEEYRRRESQHLQLVADNPEAAQKDQIGLFERPKN